MTVKCKQCGGEADFLSSLPLAKSDKNIISIPIGATSDVDTLTLIEETIGSPNRMCAKCAHVVLSGLAGMLGFHLSPLRDDEVSLSE